MRPRVKVCGLTRLDDVRLAADLGADALGFIFAPSKRRLTLDEARPLAAAAPVWGSRVGVFGPDQHAVAAEIAEDLRLDTLQFHGAPDLGAPTEEVLDGTFSALEYLAADAERLYAAAEQRTRP